MTRQPDPDTQFKPTACNLCYANCGILVEVAGREIAKVRGDKAHVASKGYICNKAARINYYQNSKARLLSPLRRRDDGSFEEVSWERAITEIAARFADIRDTHGGNKIIYYGGGGQGNHLGGTYSGATRAALGMRYASNALAQEKTGLFWTSDRVLGGHWHGDFEQCDVAVFVGKNPWQSNGLQRARVRLRELSKDPDKTLIVFDPRRTETAEFADIHFAVRPGTDTWCIAAILGFMVQEGLANLPWLSDNTKGYQRVLEQLGEVPVEEYARFSGVPMELVKRTARVLSATDKIAVYEDLGIEQSPNSTLCSYLNLLLFLLPGAFGNQGGMHLVNGLANLGAHGGAPRAFDEKGYECDFSVTPVTGARIVSGLMPCNSIAEEILTDHPERLRGMLIESANPLHSLADTKRFKEAMEALEFVVVIDVAMTETALAADYVLPASSQYEKYESTFFPSEFPKNFYHLRPPVVEPLPGTLPEAEIHARIVEALGVFAPGELDALQEAAEAGMDRYAEAMMVAMATPKILRHIAYVLYRTLGPTLPNGAAVAASLWGLCQRFAMAHEQAVRAAGHEGQGFALGNNLFKAILEGNSGVVISRHEVGDASQWPKEDGKVHLHMAEMSDEIDALQNYELPERSAEFPLVLSAGERRLYSANTIIRDPAWMKSNNPDSLCVHPNDASALGLGEASRADLVTKRGRARVRIELDDRLPLGSVSLPNGLGMAYPNQRGDLEVVGVAPNELTGLDDRDPWVGTPWHKHVAARLEPV